MGLKRKKRISYANKQNDIGKKHLFELLPIFLTIGLLPLMVRLHMYNTGLSQFDWYYAGEEDSLFGDTFLYYRQWLFAGITLYMIIILIGKICLNRKSLKSPVIIMPLGVYFVLVVLSSIFSQYKEFSFGGIWEQFENVYVLMGYAVIVYYALIVIKTERDIKMILYTLTGSTIILGLIGTFQTFGFDYYTSPLGIFFMVPEKYMSYIVDIDMTKSRAYMTLYNPNYVGVYVAMLLPFFITLMLFSKKWWQTIIYGFTCALLLISLYGSGSKAAFLVIAILILILIAFLRHIIMKYWYLVIPGACAFVCGFLLINQYYDYAYTNNIMRALQINPVYHSLQEMSTEKDGIHILYNDNTVVISMENKENQLQINIRDEYGNKLETNMLEDGMTLQITDTRFPGFEVCPTLLGNQMFGFSVKIEKRNWYFTNQLDSDGTYHYFTDKGKYDQMVIPERMIFNNYESAFSGRGYIWSVTIPLLKKFFFLGSGADTFATVFPQQDYLGLWRNGYSNMVMTKPHSLYLQVGVQTGVISLIALITFFIMYGISSIRLYINSRFETFYEQVGVAVFLAVIGFVVMGLSNDSCTAVSPIFWAITGLGVFVNSKCKDMKKELMQDI